MELATVNNQTMAIKEYNGQRVLTFKDIDKAHGRPDGTAGRAFRANRKHFIQNVDFYCVKPSDIQNDEIRRSEINNRGTIMITESGYLMLAKSFTDDLAWTVQRELVNCYFRYKEQKAPKYTESEQLTLESEGYTRIQSALKSCGYNYQERTYDGIPVVTTSDIAYFIGITADSSRALLKEKGVYGKDYFKISGADMIKFKHQNKNCPQWSTLTLVTKSGFMLIAEHFGRTKNPPPCFITDNKPVVAEKPKQRAAAHEFPRPTVDELIVALNVIQYARHNSEECEKIANMSIMNDHYAKEQASLDTARKYIGMMLTL